MARHGGWGQREKEREKERKSQTDSPLSAEPDSELYLMTLRL